VGKPEGKYHYEDQDWVDNIKINLKRDRMEWYGLD
jgi:hypothetical protein